MRLRELISRLLRERMNARPDLDTQVKVSQRAKIAQSSVQRLLAKDQAATVDLIEDLARAFGIKPAQYFLLNADEIALLQGYARLNPAERAELVRKMELAPGPGQAHHGGLQQLNFDADRPVPPELLAASQRASATKATASTMTDSKRNGTRKTTGEGRRKKA